MAYNFDDNNKDVGGALPQDQASLPQAPKKGFTNITSMITQAAKKQPTQQPKELKTAQQGIQSAQANLQNEANAYISKYNDKALAQGVSADTIAKGIGGDQASFDAIQKALANAPGMADKFKPQTDTDIEEVQQLKDLKGIAQKHGGAQMTEGEAAFDAMLMGQDERLRGDIYNLGLAQEGLSKEKGETIGRVEKEAGEKLKAAGELKKSETQKGVKSYLDALMAQQKTEQDELARQYRDFRGSEGGRAFAEESSKKALEQIIANARAGGADYADYLSMEGLDPGEFASAQMGAMRPEDFLDIGEAQKANMALSMLQGSGAASTIGQPMYSGSYKPPGFEKIFDIGGFGEKAIAGAKARKGAADKAAADKKAADEAAAAEQARRDADAAAAAQAQAQAAAISNLNPITGLPNDMPEQPSYQGKETYGKLGDEWVRIRDQLNPVNWGPI